MGVQAHSTSRIAPLPSLALSTGDYTNGSHNLSWRDRSGRGASIDNGVAVHLRARNSLSSNPSSDLERTGVLQNHNASQARLESENNRLRKMIYEQEKALQTLSDSTTLIDDLISNADLDNATREWLFVEFQTGTLATLQSASKFNTGQGGGGGGNKYSSARNTSITSLITEHGCDSSINIAKFGTWEFNPWDFKDQPAEMNKVCTKLFQLFRLPEQCAVNENQLMKFIECTMNLYRANPYHNSLHAFDVMHTTAVCLLAVNDGVVSPLDTLSVLIAAAVHDVEHPGNTNAFEVNSQSELAIMYNDTAVLESFSLNVTFRKVLNDPSTNILASLGDDERRYARNVVINCVLATDMARHFDAVSKLEEYPIGTFSGTKELLPEQKLCLLECLVHAADISNVCKSWKESMLWSEAIAQEFKDQGVKERELGLPVNPFGSTDMEKTTDRMCINFIDFVAGPLWVSLTEHLNKFDEPIGHMIFNRGKWMEDLSDHLKTLNTEKSKTELSQLNRRTNAFHESFLAREIEHEEAEAMSEMINAESEQPNAAKGHAATLYRGRKQSVVASFMASMNKQRVPDIDPNAFDIDNDGTVEGEVGDQHGGGVVVAPLAGIPEDLDNEKTEMTAEEMSQMYHQNGMDQTGNKKSKDASVTVMPRQLMSAINDTKGDKEGALNLKDDLPKTLTDILEELLEHNVTQAIVAVLTVFALFGDDVRLCAAPASWDDGFGAVTILTFLMFLFELLIQSYLSPRFRFGFFFWLDVIATVSLIPDIPWIWALLIGSEVGTSTESLNITRAGRASRAGAKAGRIVRIIRLVRLLRILKVYGLFVKERERVDYKKKRMVKRYSRLVAKRQSMERNTTMRMTEGNTTYFDHPREVHPESKVGAKLADLTTRRVIIGVLCMLFLTPFINYVEYDESMEVGVGLIHSAALRVKYQNSSSSSFESLMNSFVDGTPSLLYLHTEVYIPKIDSGVSAVYGDEYNGTLLVDRRTPEIERTRLSRTRATEFHEVFFGCLEDVDVCIGDNPMFLEGFSPGLLDDLDLKLSDMDGTYGRLFCGCADEITVAFFNLKDQSQETAARSIILTVFVIVLLGCGTMVFSKDAHDLVINPIENMVRIVQELAANPLKKFDDEPSKIHQGYETVLLENCIKKIGGLLQVGFGEAGAEIIAANMNGEGELDPMIPGKLVRAIFGVCSIRNFVPTTDILKKEVMMFVNEISSIVHSQVSSYGGCANKNTGDSFLLVWKLPSATVSLAETGRVATRRQLKKDSIRENRMWQELGNKSLMAFLKIITDVTRNEALARYSDPNDDIGKVILTSIPDFRVELCFGLHIGWAVEGAIGSDKKIDASYLSPHLMLTTQLQQATDIYGVRLLMSGEFYNLLSMDAKRNSRKLDVVKFEESSEPIAIYTYDCVTKDLNRKLHAIRLKGNMEFELEEEDRRISIIGPNPIIDHSRNAHSVDKLTFRTDLEVRALQWELPRHFLPLFRKAVRVYLDGKWKEARKLFEATANMADTETSGPSKVLLEFMAKSNFVAPSDWEGYRELNGK